MFGWFVVGIVVPSALYARTVLQEDRGSFCIVVGVIDQVVDTVLSTWFVTEYAIKVLHRSYADQAIGP